MVAAHDLVDRAGPRPTPAAQLQLVVQRRLAGAAAEQRVETLFVEDGDAELLGLGQLGSRTLARDDVARLLRHAAGHLSAARRDLAGRFVARALRERAREHERETGERIVDRRGLRALVAGEVHAGLAQPLDESLVPVDREPLAEALRDRRPDAV